MIRQTSLPADYSLWSQRCKVPTGKPPSTNMPAVTKVQATFAVGMTASTTAAGTMWGIAGRGSG